MKARGITDLDGPDPRNFPRWTPEEYRARPRDFDPGLADTICERVANGEVLTEICEDRDMPFPATFLRWVRSDPELTKTWHAAQVDRLDVMVEECVVLASGKDAYVSRNQIMARHWMGERLNPKKFAQRQNLSVGLDTSGDAEAGVDYGGEVRKKLEDMAARVAVTRTANSEGEKV